MSYPGRRPGSLRVGIGAPPEEIADRLAALGSFDAQRLFDPASNLTKGDHIADAWAAGRLAFHSTKPNPYTWDDVAAGRADQALGRVGEQLAALEVPVLEVFHHEPINDGAAASFASAATRALPLLCQGDLVTPALNLNGFAFGAGQAPGGGHTDAQLAAWVPDSLIAVTKVLTLDAYQADRNSVVDLLARFEDWAASRGITELGVGELGTFEAADLRAAFAYLLEGADRWGVVCCFDSERNINRPGVPRTVWRLLGDKLDAFREAVIAGREQVVVDPRDARIVQLEQHVLELERQLVEINRTAGAQVAELQRHLALAVDAGDAARATLADYEHRLDTIAGIAQRGAA